MPSGGRAGGLVAASRDGPPRRVPRGAFDREGWRIVRRLRGKCVGAERYVRAPGDTCGRRTLGDVPGAGRRARCRAIGVGPGRHVRASGDVPGAGRPSRCRAIGVGAGRRARHRAIGAGAQRQALAPDDMLERGAICAAQWHVRGSHGIRGSRAACSGIAPHAQASRRMLERRAACAGIVRHTRVIARHTRVIAPRARVSGGSRVGPGQRFRD